MEYLSFWYAVIILFCLKVLVEQLDYNICKDFELQVTEAQSKLKQNENLFT